MKIMIISNTLSKRIYFQLLKKNVQQHVFDIYRLYPYFTTYVVLLSTKFTNIQYKTTHISKN